MDKGEVAERVLRDTGWGANAREQLLLIRGERGWLAGSENNLLPPVGCQALDVARKLWEEQSGARGVVWPAAFGWLVRQHSVPSLPAVGSSALGVYSVFATRDPTLKVSKPVGGSFFEDNLACWSILSLVRSQWSFLDHSSWFLWSILCRGAFLSGVSHYFSSGILECCSRLRVQSCVTFHL